MCGIAGIYYFDNAQRVERSTLERMTAAIHHRGPNGGGLFIDGPVGLGHRRLSVIDLEGGAQPMVDAASGKVIVFNGEIYNYRQLRTQLAAAGTTFRTKSDTEVLLHLANPDIGTWLPRLNGMFAFALWNPRARSLLLLRDRFGVKPLYYVVNKQFFAFASEIKALLQIPGVPAELNREAVAEYVAFRHVVPPATLFHGIKQLPGGHYIHLEAGATDITVRRYWDETEALAGLAAHVDRDTAFEDIFASAVQQRLVSDVPLGTFNSGGVDSSLVTREVRNNRATGELHTFSVGFSEQSHDESGYALQVAGQLGTTHHAESLTPLEYAQQLPEAIWHHDEPLCHPHSVHLMHLSGVASRYVTVALTGEGADELFAGYPRLRIPLYSRLLGPLTPLAGRAATQIAQRLHLRRIRKLADVMANSVPAAIDSHRYIDLDDLNMLCKGASYVGHRQTILAATSLQQSFLERLLEYERRSYMQSLLVRLDKMSMAHGLEARTPFLDYRLVLWSKIMPFSAKLGRGWANKPILKQMMAKHFTHELAYRPKVGFGVPLTSWFREQPAFKELLTNMCGDTAGAAEELFPRAAIRALVSSHMEGQADHTEALWILMNLHVWKTEVLPRLRTPCVPKNDSDDIAPLRSPAERSATDGSVVGVRNVAV